jgi:uncharacterized protein
MLTREEIRTVLRDDYDYLAAEYGVKRIGLFGSYARGTTTEASNVDLIVEFERPIGFRFTEFADVIKDLLGKPVDILTPAGLQTIRVESVAERIEESIVYA